MLGIREMFSISQRLEQRVDDGTKSYLTEDIMTVWLEWVPLILRWLLILNAFKMCPFGFECQTGKSY